MDFSRGRNSSTIHQCESRKVQKPTHLKKAVVGDMLGHHVPGLDTHTFAAPAYGPWEHNGPALTFLNSLQIPATPAVEN